MFVHLFNWATMATYLGGLLPAKFVVLLLAIHGSRCSSSPDENDCELLIWFVCHLLRQDKYDQVNSLIECTNFSFVGFVYKRIKEYSMLPYDLIPAQTCLKTINNIDPGLQTLRATISAAKSHYGDGRQVKCITWMCEQIERESPSEKRDIYVTFIITSAINTRRFDIIDQVIKTFPPVPQNFYTNTVTVMISRCNECNQSTPTIQYFAEAFGLSDTELLQGCQASNILHRYFLCENEESAEWLLRRACRLRIESTPWLLTTWYDPKCLPETIFSYIKLVFPKYDDTAKRRIEVFTFYLRKILPPGFTAPDGACARFVRNWFVADYIGESKMCIATANERLLDALGFDTETYVREEFQAVCVPKGDMEMAARDPACKYFRKYESISYKTVPWHVIFEKYSHLGVVLEWLKTRLAPSDLIYPDGFSRFLSELTTSHTPDNNASIKSFLKAMGYTAANERKHGWPTKKLPKRSLWLGPSDIDARIPEE